MKRATETTGRYGGRIDRFAMVCILLGAMVLLAFVSARSEPAKPAKPAESAKSVAAENPVMRPGRRMAGGAGATVLIYHRFGEERFPTTNIAADRFEEQLAYLRENDYHVLSLHDMMDRILTGQELPDRSVVITIDDGYKSTYEVAWPLLRKYDFPFTVFVYVEATDKNHRGYMTWEQIREMQASGVDIQNHGYGHLHMTERPPGLSDEEYQAWIRADLAVSTRILSEELGRRPEFFAVPYGEYNRQVIDEARMFGYRAIFMQDPGSVSPDSDPFAIPREPILGYDWATMEHFEKVLERVDLPLTDMEPVMLTKGETPTRFSARLLYPERYRPGTLGIYVSELGWQQATLRGDRVMIDNERPLTRPFNRVAVSAREKETNRIAIRFWLLPTAAPEEQTVNIPFGPGGATMQ